MDEILSQIQLFIFDVDGTLILGSKPLPYSREVIELLKAQKKDFIIISNNSSFSLEENKQRLEKSLEIQLDYVHLLSSVQASIYYLKKNEITSCYIVGTANMIEEFEKQGIQQNTENPEAILLGYDKTLTYDKIAKVAILLQQEPRIPFYATHADKTCPVDGGKVPDVGSFLKMFEEATDRLPDMIFGKPNDIMIKLSMKNKKIGSENVLIIGDRLETDIKMANFAGIHSVLVLTGDSKKLDVENSENKPTLIWKNLEQLYEFLL